MDFDFGDDLFESKVERKLLLANKPYQAKIVIPKEFLNELDDGLDLEERVNLKKFKADYYFNTDNITKAFDLYKTCLDLSKTSKHLNKTLFQKELDESYARCCLKLCKYDEALEICKKLESTVENILNYMTVLNLRVKVFEELKKHSKNNESECLKELILTYLKLLIWYPTYGALWIKAANLFDSLIENENENMNDLKNYYKYCFYFARDNIFKQEYNKPSPLLKQQIIEQRNWVDQVSTKIGKIDEELEAQIFNKIEYANKLEDFLILEKLREFHNLNDLYTFWFKY